MVLPERTKQNDDQEITFVSILVFTTLFLRGPKGGQIFLSQRRIKTVTPYRNSSMESDGISFSDDDCRESMMTNSLEGTARTNCEMG